MTGDRPSGYTVETFENPASDDLSGAELLEALTREDVAPDPVTARLAEIEAREQAAICGPWTLETERDWDDEGPWESVSGIRMPEPHTERPDGTHRDYDYRYSEVCEMGMPTAEFLVAARSDIPRLLGAVRAGLALADDWHQKAMGIGSKMDISDADGAKAGFMMCTISAYEDCSKALLAAIARELLKEGT